MKLLTISIAAYNVEKYIKETLNSLIDERIIGELDIIIVNDGSTDNTYSIAKQFEEKYPESIRVVNKENGGFGSTLNTSIPLAIGKYYKLLDGDDWYDTEELVKFIDILKRNSEDIIITPYVEVINETKEKRVKSFLSEEMDNNKFTYTSFPDNWRLLTPEICFKTKTIQNKNIKITEKCFYTDTEYVIKCMSKCETMRYVACPFYMYRIGLTEQSMNIEGIKKHYLDLIKVFKELVRYEKEETDNEVFINNYLKNAMIACGAYIQNILVLVGDKKELIAFEDYLRTNTEYVYKGTSSKKMSLWRKARYYGFGLLHYKAKKEANQRVNM